MPRPCPRPQATLLLPPRLCGPVADYVLAWRAGAYMRDWDTRHDKRAKDAHRFTIADTRGPLGLTVPVAKPHGRCRWSDVELSGHGEWWDVHRVALESAYGRTPYFEFYIDRFLPMLTPGVVGRYGLLKELAMAWERGIASVLGLRVLDAAAGGGLGVDGSEVSEPALPGSPGFEPAGLLPPYRQVRQDKLGFTGGLSVLDLIFNLGPEAQVYLNVQAKNM